METDSKFHQAGQKKAKVDAPRWLYENKLDHSLPLFLTQNCAHKKAQGLE